MRKLAIYLFILLMPLSVAFAVEDVYSFDSVEKQQQFETLTAELRCLVCQNQNIAESNASLATDLREQIYHKIIAGESNQAIIDYLVARYGNFILYNPPMSMSTLLLWAGPLCFLLVGMGFLILYILKRQKTHA